jgi:hypothetical protein
LVSALAKRELGSPLGRQIVRGPNGEFQAEVEAGSAPKVTRDGDALVFSADLGTQVPLTCTVFPTAWESDST